MTELIIRMNNFRITTITEFFLPWQASLEKRLKNFGIDGEIVKFIEGLCQALKDWHWYTTDSLR